MLMQPIGSYISGGISVIHGIMFFVLPCNKARKSRQYMGRVWWRVGGGGGWFGITSNCMDA